jgi:hypothetical protein
MVERSLRGELVPSQEGMEFAGDVISSCELSIGCPSGPFFVVPS